MNVPRKAGKLFQKRKEKSFPIIICLSLPWLNIISTSPYREELDIPLLLIRWLITSGFLLVLWYANAWLFDGIKQKWKWPAILVANAVIIGVLMVPGLLFGEDLRWTEAQPLWLLISKFAMGSVSVIVIQSIFRAIRTNEQLKAENFELQTENYRAQLDQLKKQVNPHFLFNSLSTLQTMIRNKNDQSGEFVYNLSDVYRQLLQTRESHEVSLREELEFLNSYLYLLKVRHDSALEVNIQSLEDSLDHKLPSFGLQLLVENCTKHNIISEKRPLKINISQPDPFSITVTNNYQPRKNVQSFGVGLDNLRKRYDLMKIQDGVQVRQDENEYAVTLKLF